MDCSRISIRTSSVRRSRRRFFGRILMGGTRLTAGKSQNRGFMEDAEAQRPQRTTHKTEHWPLLFPFAFSLCFFPLLFSVSLAFVFVLVFRSPPRPLRLCVLHKSP